MRLGTSILLSLAAALAPAAVSAQTMEPQGFRADILNDLAVLEQKFVGLAEAVPESSYGWRPSDEVRSISQVYTHIVAGNYMFAGFFAEGRPDDVGIPNAPRNLEEVTQKAQVLALMRHMFPLIRQAVESTPDSELDREVTMFGQPTTVRNAMLTLITHMHEHLGQSIAYARSVGVTPPWSR